MSQRLPKHGFRSNRFNTAQPLETINLGKIAYFIQKGVLDPSQPISMKVLFDTGVLTSIKHGVKILGQGADKLTTVSQQLGEPIRLEASDATEGAIAAISSTGGSIEMTYRTPLLLRYYLKPHKFPEYTELKTPMPSPKRVKKLERLRAKGLDVSYPDAPWFTYHREQLAAEAEATKQRIATAAHADLLPKYPADRSEGASADRPRIERKQLFTVHKYL